MRTFPTVILCVALCALVANARHVRSYQTSDAESRETSGDAESSGETKTAAPAKDHNSDERKKQFEQMVRRTAKESNLSDEATNQVMKIMKDNWAQLKRREGKHHHGQELSDKERSRLRKACKANWEKTKRDARDEVDESEQDHLETFFRKMEEQFKKHHGKHHHHKHHHKKHHHHHHHHDNVLKEFVMHTMREAGISEENQPKLLAILKSHQPRGVKLHGKHMSTEEKRKAVYEKVLKGWNAAKKEAYNTFDDSEKTHLDKFFAAMEEKLINKISNGQIHVTLARFRLSQVAKKVGLSEDGLSKVYKVLSEHNTNKTAWETFKDMTPKARKAALRKHWESIKADCRAAVDDSDRDAVDKFFKELEALSKEAAKHHHDDDSNDSHRHRRHHGRHHDDDDDDDSHRHHHRRHRHHDEDDEDSGRRHRRHHREHDDDSDDDEGRHRHHHRRHRHHDDDEDRSDEDVHRHRRSRSKHHDDE